MTRRYAAHYGMVARLDLHLALADPACGGPEREDVE